MSKKRSRDNTAPNIQSLEAEKRRLLIDKINPKRLDEVKKALDWLYYGLK